MEPQRQLPTNFLASLFYHEPYPVWISIGFTLMVFSPILWFFGNPYVMTGEGSKTFFDVFCGVLESAGFFVLGWEFKFHVREKNKPTS